MPKTKSRTWSIFVILLLMLVIAGTWFYFALFRSTREALRRAESFAFARNTVTRLGEQGEMRYFFVTNRKKTDDHDLPAHRFGNQREDTLKFGRFDTSVEPSVGLGMFVNPSKWFQDEEIKVSNRGARIEQRAAANPEVVLPPTLVFKSTVDATVSTDAVIDNLLEHVHPHRHELVLFDVNRYAASYRMLIDDPAPLTNRVLDATDLPCSVTLVTNQHAESARVESRYIGPFARDPDRTRPLELAWPPGVISLSHVALPFAPDDPVYGQRPPESDEFVFLGQLALQGERGLLSIPPDWMFRPRYNPFYEYVERRSLEWMDEADENSALMCVPGRTVVSRRITRPARRRSARHEIDADRGVRGRTMAACSNHDAPP